MVKTKSFNEAYRRKSCYWGIKPNEVILTAIDKIAVKDGSKALDLGGGEGRDAIFLAKRGFAVTLVDKAEEGLENARKLVKKKDVEIRICHSDITTYPIKGRYDLVVCNNVLQFMEKEEGYTLLKKIKSHTSKQGINIIKAFSYQNPNKKFNFLLSKGELRKIYSSWEVLDYREYLTPIEKHGNEPHRHGIVEIIARKR